MQSSIFTFRNGLSTSLICAFENLTKGVIIKPTADAFSLIPNQTTSVTVTSPTQQQAFYINMAFLKKPFGLKNEAGEWQCVENCDQVSLEKKEDAYLITFLPRSSKRKKRYLGWLQF